MTSLLGGLDSLKHVSLLLLLGGGGVVFFGGLFLLRKLRSLIKFLILGLLLLLVFVVSLPFLVGHHSILTKDIGVVHQGQEYLLRDQKIWLDLSKDTPTFHFNDSKVQYIVFNENAALIFKPVPIGEVVKFPAVSKTLLPFGITFKIVSKEVKDGKFYLGVMQPKGSRILTWQALKAFMESHSGVTAPTSK